MIKTKSFSSGERRERTRTSRTWRTRSCSYSRRRNCRRRSRWPRRRTRGRAARERRPSARLRRAVAGHTFCKVQLSTVRREMTKIRTNRVLYCTWVRLYSTPPNGTCEYMRLSSTPVDKNLQDGSLHRIIEYDVPRMIFEGVEIQVLLIEHSRTAISFEARLSQL